MNEMMWLVIYGSAGVIGAFAGYGVAELILGFDRRWTYRNLALERALRDLEQARRDYHAARAAFESGTQES